MGDHAAFFYGTLMIPGILYRVIYGSPKPESWQQGLTSVRPAILEGYQRHRVKGVQYPAVVPCEGAIVRGGVCTGLTDGDLWRLDIFEGDDYNKVKAKAKVLKDEVGLTGMVPAGKLDECVVEEVEVNVYVWKDSERYRLEEQEWDFEEFREKKMKKWTGEDESNYGQDVDEGFADVERAIAKDTGEAGSREPQMLVASQVNDEVSG